MIIRVGVKPISVAACGAVVGSLALAACGGSAAGSSTKPWAASDCKTALPDWSRAKSNYAELMASVSDPAKPSGTLTWGQIAHEFGTTGNDLSTLSADAPGSKTSQALSSASDGASAISEDEDLWAAGTMPPGQTFGDSPHATIATITSVIDTYCG